MKKVQNEGFTLIELIFVLVIFAILLSVLIVMYPGLNHNMKVNTDRVSAQNVANAVRNWYIDWNTDDSLKDKLREKLKDPPSGYGLLTKTVELSEIKELKEYVDITGNKPVSLLNNNKVKAPNQSFFIGFIDTGLDVRIVISVGVNDSSGGVDISRIDKSEESNEIALYDGYSKGIIYIEPLKAT